MDDRRFTAIHAQDVAGRIVEGRELSEEQAKACVFRILSDNVLCSIATVTPEGYPHINTAYFSFSDSLDLYFLSHPGSRHCRNLSIHPAMAMSVFATAQEWTEPGVGVQLFGVGEETSESSAEEAERGVFALALLTVAAAQQPSQLVIANVRIRN
jgi:uncharacterized protein YhbP (UPF0306 family)